MYRVLVVVFLASFLTFAQPARITLLPTTSAGIDNRLFSHFIEKCSWGNEIGGDLLIDSVTKRPNPKAVSLIQALQIPMLRFPGGTDWDYHNWHELIDIIPGKQTHRPAYLTRENRIKVSDHRLGLHEFLNFCEEERINPLLVINIGDIFLRKITLDSGVRHALALYDYCNGTVGRVKDGLTTDWPAIRALNGRTKPYNVTYFELGNEPWNFVPTMGIYEANSDSLKRYMDIIKTIALALKKRDPNVSILVDVTFKDLENKFPEVKTFADYVVLHTYHPWDINFYKKGDKITKPARMKPVDIWNAWVCTPQTDSITGFTSYVGDWGFELIRKVGLPIAITEWNWNGWHNDKAAYESDIAKAIGAVGYLHAFMRHGADIKIACQSMLIGQSWGITSVRVSKNNYNDMRLLPTGIITGFYSKHHGASLSNFIIADNQYYTQPYEANAIKAQKKVAMVDVVTTKSKGVYYVHLLSRGFATNQTLVLDATQIKAKGVVRKFELLADEKTDQFEEKFTEQTYLDMNNIIIDLKPQSVTILEISINE